MPMPPPNPTTEGRRDRQAQHELSQIVRALKEEGPQSVDLLAQAVGARFWDEHRFDRVLASAVANGVVVRDVDGNLHAT